MVKVLIILQNLNPSKQRFAVPYDSTKGTGAAFGWVVAVVFFVLILGIVKAYHDDKKWKGRALNRPQKPLRSHVYKFDS